jgi:hypothetical protein
MAPPPLQCRTHQGGKRLPPGRSGTVIFLPGIKNYLIF